MIIDWEQAPIGTTHATINGGEPRWYQETLGGMNCWNVATATWFQSFFSSPSDIEDNGLRLYALGEQSEMVMLREQRDSLLSLVKELVGIEGPQPGTAEWSDKAMAIISMVEGTK